MLVDANFLYTEQTSGHFSPSKRGLGGGRGMGRGRGVAECVAMRAVGLMALLHYREHYREHYRGPYLGAIDPF